MRRLGHGLIVAGLLAALIGEVVTLVDREADVYQEEVAGAVRDSLKLAPSWLSLWSAMGAGGVISGVGVVLLLLRPPRSHRRRRLNPSQTGGKDIPHRSNLER